MTDKTATWPSWSPEPHSEGDVYHVGDWGRVTVVSHMDETDVLIEFVTSSLEARRAALTFAEELVVQVQEQPSKHAEFIAAGDHYHVRVKDFGSQELRVAHGLLALLVRRHGSTKSCTCCPCCQRSKL